MGIVRERPHTNGPHAFGLFADCARAWRPDADRLAISHVPVRENALARTTQRAERSLDRERNYLRRTRGTCGFHAERRGPLQLGGLGSGDDFLFDYGIEFGCSKSVSVPRAVATGSSIICHLTVFSFCIYPSSDASDFPSARNL